nr:L515 [uncultured bacterium]
MDSLPTPATPELLDQVQGNISLKHYSIRTARPSSTQG